MARALAALAALHVAAGSVIGIDFGSAWMKVALVQLKVPLEIVPNTISKRKTEIVVSFDRGERMYGSDAFGLLSRKPNFGFAHFRELLGRDDKHPLTSRLAEHMYGVVAAMNSTRGGMDMPYTGDKNVEAFSAEELTAMVFRYARDIVKDFGGQAVRDAVITVPAFATMHERRALVTAAEIAGLKVLSLIEDNTAAALQYGKDNVEEKKTVLYYNLGASATQVSIVQYSNYTVKELGKSKEVGSFEVLAKQWDATLGGEQFDLKVMNYLADEFKSKFGTELRAKAKPMAKLRAQATKTKEVLSANTEMHVKVNSLHDDKDLALVLTRTQFEGLCQDLFKRLTPPIDRALAQAKLTVADLDAVEMLGGGQRIPEIQKRLGDYFGSGQLSLGVHLNADEAMALGAAFEAANISTAFKVRKTGMTDFSPFPITVGLASLPSTETGGVLGGLFGGGKKKTEAEIDEAANWKKTATVFKAWSKLDSKKVLAFHHDQDIKLDVSYAEQPAQGEESMLPPGTRVKLSSFNVTGVEKFAKGMGAKNLTVCGNDQNPKPKVTLHFKLDSSGMVVLTKAEATCDKPEEPKADGEEADGAKGSDKEGEEEKKDEAEAKEGDQEEKKEEEEKEGGEKEGEEDSKEGEEEEKKEEETAEEKKKRKEEEKKKKKEEKKAAELKKKAEKLAKKKASEVYKSELAVSEDLTLDETKASSPAAVAESQAKLNYLQALDDARFAKMEAKNGLEGFLYDVKGKLDDEAEALEQVSTEAQRAVLLEAAQAALDWLDDEGFDQEAAVYKTKQTDVMDLSAPLFFRLEENSARPAAVKMATKRLKDIRLLVAKWEESMPQVTEEERGEVLALVAKAEAWLDEKVALQAEVPGHEAPKFTANEVSAQLKPTANLVTKLSRKPKPKPKPVELNATDTAANATDTAANATESDAGAESSTPAEGAGETGTEGAEGGESAKAEDAAEKGKDEL
eukprot:CAMPEP_0172615954 /NCGR_PEP_ID=MMETSP1068-20121228/62611_1 /TAXON_ID=35684 /ORGANISM="Pseudopedinella elastica, Strain CCMP716" /LENGTH=966 /DNA_ID=CAMNT_0013421253 /DNA_START=59 /DNA_END=2959 /DNA_ORIENTATION=+